jgi:NifB/MoaA-like Fe-S oxidoreductase
LPREMEISLVTGQSGECFLNKFIKELDKIKGLRTHLYVIPNSFWGGNVTVVGLLTGSDLMKSLRGKNLGDVLFIPSVMLKESSTLFLDNMSLDFLSAGLKVRIVPVKGLVGIKHYLWPAE